MTTQYTPEVAKIYRELASRYDTYTSSAKDSMMRCLKARDADGKMKHEDEAKGYVSMMLGLQDAIVIVSRVTDTEIPEEVKAMLSRYDK
jgi:hypothetical protein